MVCKYPVLGLGATRTPIDGNVLTLPPSGPERGREALIAAPQAVPMRLSRSAHSRSRRTNFWILPVEVFGSGPNSIESGHL